MNNEEVPIYCGFDPGKTTGFAFYIPPDKFYSGEENYLYLAQRIGDMWASYDRVVCYVELTRPSLPGRSTTYQPEGTMFIGMLEFLCFKHWEAKYTLQTPSQAKATVTDQMLRELGLYNKGHGHANDAMRHLILGLMRDRVWRIGDVVVFTPFETR